MQKTNFLLEVCAAGKYTDNLSPDASERGGTGTWDRPSGSVAGACSEEAFFLSDHPAPAGPSHPAGRRGRAQIVRPSRITGGAPPLRGGRHPADRLTLARQDSLRALRPLRGAEWVPHPFPGWGTDSSNTHRSYGWVPRPFQGWGTELPNTRRPRAGGDSPVSYVFFAVSEFASSSQAALAWRKSKEKRDEWKAGCGGCASGNPDGRTQPRTRASGDGYCVHVSGEARRRRGDIESTKRFRMPNEGRHACILSPFSTESGVFKQRPR